MPTKPSLLFLLILLSLSSTMLRTAAQQKAPNFTLTDIDGNLFTLSECTATVVLVDVFATWCGPCRLSIPTFRELYNEYTRNQLEIVSISSEDMSTLESFAYDPQTEMTWIVVSDPTGSVSISYLGGDMSIPHLYLVDADGYIAYNQVGWSEAEAPVLRSRINLLLEGDNTDIDPDSNPNQSGLPLTTILIIIGVVICLFVGSILAAGYFLDWSSSSKKRSKKQKKRSKKRK